MVTGVRIVRRHRSITALGDSVARRRRGTGSGTAVYTLPPMKSISSRTPSDRGVEEPFTVSVRRRNPPVSGASKTKSQACSISGASSSVWKARRVC